MRFVYDVDDLLRRFRARRGPASGTFVEIDGIDGQDGYNPSAPVPDGSAPCVYVRVETRDDEFSSWSIPFRVCDQTRWEMAPDLPMFHLQDPFTTVIHDMLVVGGVRIVARLGATVMFRTVFLRGESPRVLEEFAHGPLLMKDVRLAQLDDGTIGVFTRPLGDGGGRGRIGYTEVPDLGHLNKDTIASAPLLDTQPVPEQWWGVNHVVPLGGGLLGVLAHIARFQGPNRHYYPVVFVFDRRTRSIVHGPEIIAERAQFPHHLPKRADLDDVIFPAWIDRERGLLVGGVADSAVGVLHIGDPFERWAR